MTRASVQAKRLTKADEAHTPGSSANEQFVLIGQETALVGGGSSVEDLMSRLSAGALALAALAVCAAPAKADLTCAGPMCLDSRETRANGRVIETAENGATMERIEVEKNGRSTIVLKGLGSAGYRWTFTVDDPNIVEVKRLTTGPNPDEAHTPTWSADERFILIGRETGETVVRFSQGRPFEPTKPPIATRDVEVRVRAD